MSANKPMHCAIVIISIFIFKHVLTSSRPIHRINTLLDQWMKSRIWPFPHSFYQTMFERIDMDIIHMRTKIRVIANQVFPIAALPYAPFTACYPNLGTPLGNEQSLGKGNLDQPPASGKVGIIGWKLNDAMKMLR